MTVTQADQGTHRLQPEHWCKGSSKETRRFRRIDRIEIKGSCVSVSLRDINDDGAKKWTEAELRLMIAEMEAAKQKFLLQLDDNIAMLKAVILEGCQLVEAIFIERYEGKHVVMRPCQVNVETGEITEIDRNTETVIKGSKTSVRVQIEGKKYRVKYDDLATPFAVLDRPSK